MGGHNLLFKLVTLEDTIRIPPETFGNPLDDVGYQQVKANYEGMVDEELGYVIAVTDVKVSPVGKIIPGDGAAYHKVNFSLLTYHPEIQEVVEGEVVEIADFGAFVRIGPVDALLHVSQLMDDFISYDERQGVLIGKPEMVKIKVDGNVELSRLVFEWGFSISAESDDPLIFLDRKTLKNILWVAKRIFMA